MDVPYECVLTIVISLLCLSAEVHGFPSGAILPACFELDPAGHFGQPQQTLSPYVIKVSDRTYSARQQIVVTLESRCNSVFKGFLIQARRINPSYDQSEPIGTFKAEPAKGIKNVCGVDGTSGLTHTNNDLKSHLQFTWIAPAFTSGDIVFRATFVESYSVYWVNVTSPIIQDPGSVPVFASLNALVTPAIYPCSIREALFEKDQRCGKDRGCFHDCVHGGCTFLIWWRDAGWSEVEFGIKTLNLGSGDKWAAIGFSNDTAMGHDSVSECVLVGNTLSVYPSYNIGHSNIRITKSNQAMILLDGLDHNGVFQCSFRRNKTVPTDPRMFDLDRDWILFVANGRATPDGDKIMHIRTPLTTQVPVDLQVNTDMSYYRQTTG